MFSLTINATSSTQTTVFGDTTRETTRSVTEIIVHSRHGSARIGPFYESATSSYETPSTPVHASFSTNAGAPVLESPLRTTNDRHTSPSQSLQRFDSLSLQSPNTVEKAPHVSDHPIQLRLKPQMPTMSALLRHDYRPRSAITRPSLGSSSSASSSAVKIEVQSSPPLTFTNHDGQIREDSPLTPPPPDPICIKDEPSDDSPIARRRPLRQKERRIYFREESMTPPDPPKLKVVSVKREKKSTRGSRGEDHRIRCPSHGTCTATFSRQHDADRHNLTVHKLGQQWQWDCPVCHKHLMRQDSLERHGLKSKDHRHDRDVWKRAFCKFMSDYWVLTDVDNKTSERKALALREKLNLPP